MNGVDTISLREETTFISCFAYESVHHHHPERERKIPFSKSHFTIGRSHISVCPYLKKDNFYFENRFRRYP